MLASDATVSDDGAVVGDPTEAALVVLAAKLGVDAEMTRAQLPRLAEVPFDSAYKYMATFHDWRTAEGGVMVELVKGAPDVVLDLMQARRCGTATEVPIDDRSRRQCWRPTRAVGARAARARARLPAVRRVDEAAEAADPMAQVIELMFVGLVGIIDPLRPEAKDAVRRGPARRDRRAHDHGRPRDHGARPSPTNSVSAPGAITGAEFAALSDDELEARLPRAARVRPRGA